MKHMTRQELIETARQERAAPAEHLKTCSECRDLVEWLRLFPVAGAARLPDAPAGWIARAQELANPPSKIRNAVATLARLVFDTWAMPEPLGVREEGALDHRRMRFQTDCGVLELRAEHQVDEWGFVAQWTGCEGFEESVVIEAGRERVHTDEFGIAMWHGRRPPDRITVHVAGTRVATPEISWKSPHRE